MMIAIWAPASPYRKSSGAACGRRSACGSEILGVETRAAIDRFLDSPGLSEATRRAYRFDLEPFAAWLEGRSARLDVLDTRLLSDYAAELGRGRPRRLAPATIARKLSAVRSLVRFALGPERVPEATLAPRPPARHQHAAPARPAPTSPAPRLRHSSARGRRRLARDPGAARAQLALDHAGLQPRRCPEVATRVRPRSSAVITNPPIRGISFGVPRPIPSAWSSRPTRRARSRPRTRGCSSGATTSCAARASTTTSRSSSPSAATSTCTSRSSYSPAAARPAPRPASCSRSRRRPAQGEVRAVPDADLDGFLALSRARLAP